MRIEKICSKQDLVDSLKKAAKYSKLSHLRKLAVYVQEELDLTNLKEGIEIKCYDLKLKNNAYDLVEQHCRYNSVKNQWELLEEQVIETIPLAVVEQIGEEL